MHNRDKLMALAGVGVALAVIAVVLMLRCGAPPSEAPEPPPAAVQAPLGKPPVRGFAKPASVKTPATQAQAPSASEPAQPGRAVTVRAAPLDVAAAAAEWKPREEAEFTREDVTRGPSKVTVDLGDYEARAGEEFDVVISMTSPPLEDTVFVIEYDPEVLEPVAKSAKPLGTAGVRHGFEFYVTPAKKRVVILSSGNPGMKKVDASTGGPVVAFRVKVKEGVEGQTTLVAAQNMCFTSGRGERMPHEVFGGLVTIVE